MSIFQRMIKIPTLRNHTHCQIAQKTDTQTKTCQRVWLPHHTVRLRRIKHENTTRGIKHWGLSGYSSIMPRIKFGVTGQESSPQSPTISYRNPSDCLKSKT